MDEIRSTFGLKSFSHERTDCRSGSEELFGKDILLVFLTEVLIEVYGSDCEVERLGLDGVGHGKLRILVSVLLESPNAG